MASSSWFGAVYVRSVGTGLGPISIRGPKTPVCGQPGASFRDTIDSATCGVGPNEGFWALLSWSQGSLESVHHGIVTRPKNLP